MRVEVTRIQLSSHCVDINFCSVSEAEREQRNRQSNHQYHDFTKVFIHLS